MGFTLPQGDWGYMYQAWKRVIMCQIAYQRPFSSRECRKWTGSSRTTVDEVLQQMVDEGLATYEPPVEGSSDPAFYEVQLDKVAQYIQVVPEELYDEELYKIDCYLETLRTSDEHYNNALNSGLTHIEDIEEYIIEQVQQTVDEKLAKRARKKLKGSRKTSSAITPIKERFAELEKEGVVAQLLRGEISLEQYEQLLQDK